jgi:chaperone BCS1
MEVAKVGLGSSRKSTALTVLDPRSAFDRLKELLQSPQFQDGIKLFAIGAAVSFAKSSADAIWAGIKRYFLATATFRGRDEAYRWVLLFMTTHPNFQKSPRAVEVSARPSLLVDSQADSRGLLSEGEIQATWRDVQGKSYDEKETQRMAKEENEDKQLNIGVHFFPAPGEQMHFVFQGTHFWASRERQLVGDTEWDETITLSFLSLSSTPLRKLIKHARVMYQEHARGRVAIHRVDRYGNWTTASGLTKRSIESVHLPGTMKEDLLEDAKNFISLETKRWYGDRGIPYRRGYLFHGPPGSGKSSLCHVLASVIEQPIYVLNLSSNSMSDAEFLERMSDIPARSIVLIEDVDAAFVQREAVSDGSKKSSVSFSALLNAIDGVGASEGRLLCITTNHIDRLDKALIRPGRVDERFAFSNATEGQARDIFLRWYMPRDGYSNDITLAADAFAKSIPKDKVSVAALQGFLLGCGKEYRKAVDQVASWAVEQE